MRQMFLQHNLCEQLQALEAEATLESEWLAASSSGDFLAHLTLDEFAEMTGEFDALVTKWSAPGARHPRGNPHRALPLQRLPATMTEGVTTDAALAPRRRLPLVALLTAQLVSLAGNAVTVIAVPLYVLQTTARPSPQAWPACSRRCPSSSGARSEG